MKCQAYALFIRAEQCCSAHPHMWRMSIEHCIENSASALTEALAIDSQGGEPQRTGSAVSGHKRVFSAQLNCSLKVGERVSSSCGDELEHEGPVFRH